MKSGLGWSVGRGELLVVIATAALVATAAVSAAQASTVLLFDQIGNVDTTRFRATPGNPASTTITNKNTLVMVTSIDAGISTPFTAFFNLTATSIDKTTALDPGHTLSEAFSGIFSLTSRRGGRGTDYLSGTFSDIVFGMNHGPDAIMMSSEPPKTVLLTSSIIPIAELGFPTSFALAFTDMRFRDSGACTSRMAPGSAPGCTIASTRASVAGDFSATATPLPAALPLFATGLGALGLLRWRRKRKAQAVAT
jgi:hypothetical protein